tara:strand:+ start:1964 stop:2410 length:447 start_codon:yes stop_codon:yes gene_type:complete
MSKRISYRGIIDAGLQEKIRLSTPKGKTGYKITKFQIISPDPGTSSVELIAKVYSKDQTGQISNDIDFTENDLLAVAHFSANGSSQTYPEDMVVIFDNEVFNQNIFVTATDDSGSSKTNYYLELETVPLNDIQSTQLTLKNLRTIASR